jgi:hypothetical protein
MRVVKGNRVFGGDLKRYTITIKRVDGVLGHQITFELRLVDQGQMQLQHRSHIGAACGVE